MPLDAFRDALCSATSRLAGKTVPGRGAGAKVFAASLCTPGTRLLHLSTVACARWLAGLCLHFTRHRARVLFPLQHAYAAIVGDGRFWNGLGFEAWQDYGGKDETSRLAYSRKDE